MKKVILSFFFVLLCASYSTPSFAATSEDIMKTFDWNQGKLLDYYWVRPSEIYDQWNNGSRFMRSVLKASYVTKKDKDIIWKIQESLKDYLNDRPLYWKHELDFHRKLFQNYKKDTLPVFADYKVEERNGTLEIIHREFGFAIGTFETDGKYTSTGYWNNTGGIHIDMWNQVFYDPWDEKMYYRRFIENDAEKYTHIHVTANADNFVFRFEGDPSGQVRTGKIEIVDLKGFTYAVPMFVYPGKKKPIATDYVSDLNATKEVITFDVGYTYDERRMSMDPEGVVEFHETLDQFMNTAFLDTDF